MHWQHFINTCAYWLSACCVFALTFEKCTFVALPYALSEKKCTPDVAGKCISLSESAFLLLKVHTKCISFFAYALYFSSLSLFLPIILYI